MSLREEVLAVNQRYAGSFGRRGDLPRSPARALVILACMDARFDPARALGLEEGDAHVIRNAGGLATDDALRSLVLSHALMGAKELFVIGHTDCGLASFTNEEIRARLREETGADAGGIDFLPFRALEESIRDSVQRVRQSPFLRDLQVSGWVFDVRSGRLREVACR
jgi:carbonic anhydrase